MKYIVSIASFFLIALANFSILYAVDHEYTTSQCNRTTGSGVSSPDWKEYKRYIYVYVESDFASELNSCGGIRVNNSTDTTLSQLNFEYLVQSALEVWNQESQGDYLVYGGPLATGDPTTACNMADGPSIFIRHEADCRIVNGSCNTNSVANVEASSCSDSMNIVIRGNNTSSTSCTGTPIIWQVDSSFETGSLMLKSVLVHELGHALGIGHSNGDNDDPFETTFANMNSGVDWNHLLPYDRACAEGSEINDGDTGGRRSVFKKVGYTIDPFYGGSWGNLGNLTTFTATTDISFRSGGSLRKSLTNDDTVFGAMTNSLFFDRTAPYSQYGFTMSSYRYFSLSLLRLDTPPLIYTQFENLASNALQWILYVDWINVANNTAAEMDPPSVYYARSSNFFVSLYKRVLDSCPGGVCSSLIQSHITPSSTYDLESDTTIYAIVDTASDSNGTQTTGRRNNNGRIFIYPGHSLHFRLRTPIQVQASNHSIVPTTTDGGFAYRFETDVPVGLACADPDFSTEDFNCMIAWKDRGMLNGKILYTYFQILPDHSISWHNRVFVRGGTDTVSGVDLAFFDGTFWMTFKEAGEGAGIVIMEKTSSGLSWSSANTYVYPDPGKHFTGPPTFMYDSSFEGGSNGTDKTAAVVVSQTY